MQAQGTYNSHTFICEHESKSVHVRCRVCQHRVCQHCTLCCLLCCVQVTGVLQWPVQCCQPPAATHSILTEGGEMNSNPDIRRKFTEESSAVTNMLKMKYILEAEISLQKELMKTSILLGFSFNIDDKYFEEDVEDDIKDFVDDEELFQLYFDQQCLEMEVNVLKAIKEESERDHQELKRDELTHCHEKAEDLVDLKNLTLVCSRQLQMDIYAGSFIMDTAR